MSFGNILGQILQDGLGGQTRTRGRLSQTAQNLGGAGRGFDGILGQLQGALASRGVTTAGAGAAASGFGERAHDFLHKEQVGGLTGAQIGGIGAVAGALLGGGLGGAARGGAMAVLGTLALGALKSAQARNEGMAPDAIPDAITVEPEEVRSVTGPETERLLLRAMISAAKADGNIDQGEMQKIVGKISAELVTPEEKQFVLEEMRTAIDMQGLAADVETPAQAAEVYAASLLAIDIDTDKERRYLRDLAQALRLDDGTVAELHRMTGAPVVA